MYQEKKTYKQPNLKEGVNMKTIKLKLSNQEFNKLYDLGKNVCSKDETRPHLNGVHIIKKETKDDKAHYDCEATDGRILFRINISAEIDENDPWEDCIIELPNKIKPVRINSSLCEINEYTFNIIEGTYPDTNIIRKLHTIDKSKIKIGINFKLLEALYKAAKSMMERNRPNIYLHINTKDNAIVVTFQGTEFEAILMPLRF